MEKNVMVMNIVSQGLCCQAPMLAVITSSHAAGKNKIWTIITSITMIIDADTLDHVSSVGLQATVGQILQLGRDAQTKS